MDNNNLNKQKLSRLEKRKLEEQEEKMKIAKEEELERKRQELKATIFDDGPKKNIYKREVPVKKIEKTTKEPKKDVFTRVILSLTVLLAFTFLFYMIVDSVTKVDQMYQIINAFLIFFIVICFAIFYKSRSNVVQVITSFLIVVLMGFNGAVMSNILALPKQETVPDFYNMTLTQAINWAEANNIEYDQTFDYSDTIKKYNIISQDVKENTLLKDVSKIYFGVSNGPDYNKEVLISDMTDWNIDDAVEVIKENYLNNVTVNYEENLDIERDTITAQSKSGKIKRNDAVILTVSLGDTSKLAPIKLKNLKNKSLFDATLYLNRNGIVYELKYEFSDTIDKGNVISTSVKKGTELKYGDKITVTISKGKEIKVPELKNMTLSEVNKWMVLNNLNIDYSDAYDDNIKSGRVISATYNKGDIIEEDTTVGIVVSKGKLKMKNFSSLASFKTWADTYNIKYEVKEDFNDEVAKGEIIKFSVETGKKINAEEGVTVYVSKGKAITVPDFSGKTKSAIQKECDSLRISCSFTTQYSTGVKDGTSLSQSIKAGEKIAKGDTINIVIATNNKNEVTTSNNSSNSSSSSNNSSSSSGSSKPSTGGSSSGGSSGNTSTPTPSCKNYTFFIGGAGSTGAQTCSIIKNTGNNRFLNITCNPVYEDSCPNGDKSNGSVCSSSHASGTTVSTCDKIVINILYK